MIKPFYSESTNDVEKTDNSRMSQQYHVYIDEAGDPGVKVKSQGTGPHWTDWFTIAAVVVSDAREREIVDWVKDMKEATRSRDIDGLHYRNLSASNRARVCRMLGRKPARLFVVASHKDSMRKHYNPRLGRANDKQFYNWCLRLLLERVTEWCYRRSPSACAARLVFSERGGHPYGELRDYLRKLEAQCLTGDLVLKAKGISPGVIANDRIFVDTHSSIAGLQLADIGASAFFNAANSASQNHDLEPARALKAIVPCAPNSRTQAGGGLLRLPFLHQGTIPAPDEQIFVDFGY